MRDRNLGYDRQEQDFYPTPGWVTEALLRRVRLAQGDLGAVLRRRRDGPGPGGPWSSCRWHGFGGPRLWRGGRDFLAGTQLPVGVTAIVTNPQYGRTLYKFVDRALELTRPISGMVAMLVNTQRPAGAANSTRLRLPSKMWKDQGAYQRTATLGYKLLYGLFAVLNCWSSTRPRSRGVTGLCAMPTSCPAAMRMNSKPVSPVRITPGMSWSNRARTA
jgi:hypothetical protein